ncbi:MAG: YciI family protein [Bryobacteraceae bacterium]
MKYLCLVFIDEKKLDALSKEESDRLDRESLAYDDALRKSGHFLAAQALQSVHSATTVRRASGKVTVTDGPFAETNEQIGGFILIDAKDLDEAIRLASQIPPARLGGVEIRPIKELTGSRSQ